jgi:hypothetical protein
LHQRTQDYKPWEIEGEETAGRKGGIGKGRGEKMRKEATFTKSKTCSNLELLPFKTISNLGFL